MAEHELTHTDADGRASMVDVGDKQVSDRRAIAEGFVRVGADLMNAIRANTVKKGDVLSIARIAGIMGAKRTSDLIPLCHPLPLEHVAIDLEMLDDRVRIVASVRTRGRTGVEMEALTAVAVCALAIYDMGKSIDRAMVIEDIRLLEKSGGRSGHYRARLP